MRNYKIAQVAQKLGISKQTLVRYEKKGILPKFPRNPINSWREYTEEDVRKMRAILRKGFTPLEKAARERGSLTGFTPLEKTARERGSLTGFTPLEKTARERGSLTGFTLVEIIMVIVIIGIFIAVAIPRFSSFYSIKLDGSMKKVVADIRYAQQMAISRHGNCRVVFNPANDVYTVEEQLITNGPWSGIKDSFTRANLVMDFRTDAQYKGIDIASANFNSSNTLQFDWQGIPLAGGNVTFNYQGNTKIIGVASNTGRVNVR